MSDPNELASLAVIDTAVSVNDSKGGEGDPLAVGDKVSTNPQGFAEVNYFDGSITRVAQAAEFTVTALSDEEGDRRVESRLDAGTSWNRVKKLSQSGGYELDTPVATATATGTAFVADCTQAPRSCEFAVVEGAIELRLPDGTVIEMSAPESLTVTADQSPPAPRSVAPQELVGDSWITANVELDGEAGFEPIPFDDGTGGDDEQGAGGDALASALQAGLPVLTDEEAGCAAEVMLDSLGDAAEVIRGRPAGGPLELVFAQVYQEVVQAGTAPTVADNAAAVAACVQSPVSFSASPAPPTGDVAACVNSTLTGSSEYERYLGEFRFLGRFCRSREREDRLGW